jgi:hypothetical protein
MGRLLAARVLADHFARVTVLDRDRFPERPNHRRGVPQSHHAHALLMRGQQIAGRLFPRLVDDLLADGAAAALRSPVFVTPAGKLPPPPPAPGGGAPGVYASRILLEWHVRRRLGERPEVRFRTGTEATGLVGGADGRVVGVRLRPRDAAGEAAPEPGQEEILAADLVVDASGRQSGCPRSGSSPSATRSRRRRPSTRGSATPPASTANRPPGPASGTASSSTAALRPTRGPASSCRSSTGCGTSASAVSPATTRRRRGRIPGLGKGSPRPQPLRGDPSRRAGLPNPRLPYPPEPPPPVRPPGALAGGVRRGRGRGLRLQPDLRPGDDRRRDRRRDACGRA